MHYDITTTSQISTVSLTIDETTEYISAFNYGLKSGADNFVLLKGSKQIKLSVTIPKDSLKYYRYNLIENDTVIVKDNEALSEIDFVYPKHSDLPSKLIINLGNIKIYNKKLRLELYKLPNRFKITSVIIYNKPIVPLEISSVSLQDYSTKNGRLDTLKNNSVIDINGENNNKKFLIVSPKYNELSFLYKIKVYKPDGKTVYSENLIDYFPNDVAIPVSSLESKTISDYEIRLEYDRFYINSKNAPGKYSTLIEFGHNVFPIRISQLKEITIKQVVNLIAVVVGVLATIAALIIIYIKRKNKRKLLIEKQQKEIAKTQLDRVRSQLNPHFMFNALAGIQSLMNEQKTNEANQYLNKFARLTRNVLDNKELISLAEEKTLLDDYLQMEQLRFGFNYQIDIQTDVDLNIEIPAMLLQPFVENAVKHGIAEKGKLGEINISIAKKDTDLILQTTDNGNGFDTTKIFDGLGLQLSKNRIDLLNSIYKETALVLAIQSTEKGTAITITLKQWI
ncbi:hypothetical protein EZ428_23215 [Pedobacter frigiditerrae]|uniref:Uncharacterized protein n=2 Tax=Pedobacter frigiditerrae TaxID=2530452 RepID=A0A4R0MK35_9SPHI|nr:hypothetical protein EZ428_23215 [Pedobacter frigiditerrae]